MGAPVEASLPQQLVSDADHLSLSRLVRTDAGWRFVSRTFETLFA